MDWLMLGWALLVGPMPSADVALAPWFAVEKPVVTASSEVWADLQAKYGRPAVNARVDRVWHAIPGLQGWQLDVTASHAATTKAADGKLHLVWHPTPPEISLASLPAEPIYRGPSQEKSVALMVNVSWGEEYVPGVLAALRRAGVRATFFLDSAWVRRHPEVARSIVAAGHEVGSHGSGHPDFRRIGTSALTQQIIGTNEVLQHTLGVTPRLLAPPGGSYDQRTVALARGHGMYTILWTVDTLDWRRPPADAIVRRIDQQMEPGALILMHPTAPTVEALPRLLQRLAEKGYTCKTVGQMVDETAVVPPPALVSRDS
ncbi:hypothetical protein GCM10025857_03420 [Alicyclobacillus contaminans]|uniref:polysaccharide deacetylase family protein n=1 Tax=Alicyclobacillus contaminans TaxID=392016 RepID=UPI000426CEE1|nr:polysaccharide deacetylase family protein [Alicyclobacillus contaminans]GMA48985.1 hypothetical protein GCM10025857_03420 [Alicyclobacillus contaminans]